MVNSSARTPDKGPGWTPARRLVGKVAVDGGRVLDTG